MAKKLAAKAERRGLDRTPVADECVGDAEHVTWPEYDLVDDVVFDPPLTPEERRRIGLDITLEERLEQARRQIAEGDDGF